MIKETTMYYVVCDKCGREIEGNEGQLNVWSSKSDALDDADNEGWHIKDGKHHCEDCAEELKLEY